MARHVVPADIRPHAKRMIGDLRRARGLSVAELAARVGLSPGRLRIHEAPNSRECPGIPLLARLAYALEAPELLRCLMPPGWLVLSPEQVALVRPALVAAGILPD